MCHNYAMNKTPVFRFVPLTPIKVKTGRNTSRLSEWNADKLGTFLQARLTNAMSPAFSDADVRVVATRRPDVQFEGWTPDTTRSNPCRK